MSFISLPPDEAVGAVIAGGTVGSILFVGAGGIIQQDNTNLFWDDTNNRLGVCSASPTAFLQVDSTAAGTKVTIFKAATSQTASLSEWQNSSGTALALITAAGYGSFGAANPGSQLELEEVKTITGTVADGLSAAITLDPGYTAATAQTVTRHNYIDVQNVSNAGTGPSAVTDAAVLRFDAAAGTHKATVAATTKTTPGGVDAWLKINIDGTLHYVPAYLSTTA